MAVADTDYAATYNLTALSSQGQGLSNAGMLQKDLYAQLLELETNFNGILTKLDADSGVSDENYNSLYSIDLNDLASANGLSQDIIVSLLDDFVSDFNDTLTKLDSDSGVSDTNYNSVLALTDVVNNDKGMSTAVDDNGITQQALYTLLNNIDTNVDALNAKLDADSA